MPIVNKGIHKCEKCGREFEWQHFELLHQSISSSNFIVEQLQDTKILVHSVTPHGDKIEYAMNCPHCGYDNVFSRKCSR